MAGQSCSIILLVDRSQGLPPRFGGPKSYVHISASIIHIISISQQQQQQQQQQKIHPPNMILATFRRYQTYRWYFLIVFILCDATYLYYLVVVVQQGKIPNEIIILGNKNSAMAIVPDMAWKGYTPQQAREWYSTSFIPSTEGDQDRYYQGRIAYIQLGILDLLGIIPSYTFLLGTFLVTTTTTTTTTLPLTVGGMAAEMLCYLPIWTATFDLIETCTHVAAVTAIHLASAKTNDPMAIENDRWQPSTLCLVMASAATQFKFVGIVLSLLVLVMNSVKSWYSSHNNHHNHNNIRTSTPMTTANKDLKKVQ